MPMMEKAPNYIQNDAEIVSGNKSPYSGNTEGITFDGYDPEQEGKNYSDADGMEWLVGDDGEVWVVVDEDLIPLHNSL